MHPGSEPSGTVDGDVAPGETVTRSRAAHRDPVLLGLVFLGGVLGTTVRAQLESHVADTGTQWPWTTFAVNISGAFALALLLESLIRTGDDEGWRRRARLGLGTGLLGGYTTYSSFAVEAAQRIGNGRPVMGLGYMVLSVLLGLLAAAGGHQLARRLTRRTG